MAFVFYKQTSYSPYGLSFHLFNFSGNIQEKQNEMLLKFHKSKGSF